MLKPLVWEVFINPSDEFYMVVETHVEVLEKRDLVFFDIFLFYSFLYYIYSCYKQTGEKKIR